VPETYWSAHSDVRVPKACEVSVASASFAFQKRRTALPGSQGGFAADEGKERGRNTVMAFPSHEAAPDCYSPLPVNLAYANRVPVSSGGIVIAEGVEPQGQEG